MKKDITALLFALLALSGYANIAADLPATSPASIDPAPVSADAPLKMGSEAVGKVDRKFFGSNFLYWLENRATLADSKIETMVKALPLTLLRYPGGTVADNFHWATTQLDNPNRFPFITPAEAPDMSTFDDFMAFCRRTGAEPIVVVNTESWMLHDDAEGGIREAVEWVRYCKTNGYKVKYWEIGNETYWHPVMTAREYGALAKRYSQAMKAADPSIIVSANGHWDLNQAGAKERFPQEEWASIRRRLASIAGSADDKAAKKYIEDTRGANQSDEKWWNNVLEECGMDIDMLSVHWYFNKNNVPFIDKKLVELKEFAKAKTGRDYILCISEYNCNSENQNNGWGLAEGVCRMLNAGVTMANFWPMRMGGEPSRRSLLTNDDRKEPLYPYLILKMFSDNFNGDIVKCSSTENLFLFATKSDSQITLVVTANGNGRKSAAEGDCEIAFDADAAKGRVVSVNAFSTDEAGALNSFQPKYIIKSNGMQLHIAPATFTMIIIRRD